MRLALHSLLLISSLVLSAPYIEYDQDDADFDVEPIVIIRINYDIHCYHNHYFSYHLKRTTGRFNNLSSKDGLGYHHVNGSVAFPDRQRHNGPLYMDFEVLLFTNCTFTGHYRFDEPVLLHRCISSDTFVCDLRVFYHIFTDYPAEHLIYEQAPY